MSLPVMIACSRRQRGAAVAHRHRPAPGLERRPDAVRRDRIPVQPIGHPITSGSARRAAGGPPRLPGNRNVRRGTDMPALKKELHD
jgi:hypothetical protein